MLDPKWLEIYPELETLDDAAKALFEKSVSVVSVPSDQTIFSPGDPCDHWHMILSGSVRVVQTTSGGREMVVCRFFPGKTCIISALGVMSGDPHTTRAITDSAVTALTLEKSIFRELINSSDSFREFVFSAYNTEILSLMSLVEDVACGRIDSRLAACLLSRKEPGDVFRGTHEDLATELGTAREVVTRQLKTFEQRGWVQTGRGSVTLRNPAALQQIATHNAA
jgi:CRP/FNR family transcriptional regulator